MTKKIIRKPQAKADNQAPKATALPVIPKDFASIRMTKNGKTTVAQVIDKQRLKLAKSVSDTVTTYVELGKAMIVARQAISDAKGSWHTWMKDKPMGIGYSTAMRYIDVAEIGAEKLLKAHQAKVEAAAKQGEEAPLNVKALIADIKGNTGEKKAKGPDQAKAAKQAQPAQPDRPAVSVGDLPPLGKVSDEAVDSIVDTVIPSLTEEQAQRLALALGAHLEELHEKNQVIEGKAA